MRVYICRGVSATSRTLAHNNVQYNNNCEVNYSTDASVGRVAVAGLLLFVEEAVTSPA